MHFDVKEDIIELTSKWTGERLPDGRPRVPDEDIEALREMTMEEIWSALKGADAENEKAAKKYAGSYFTFEGDLKQLHSDNRKLVGRAVTCSYVPVRPDIDEAVSGIGHAEHRSGTYNQWVIDSLVEGDVVVADMYDKVYDGTFVGGNLSTAIMNRTKTGGAVIWGGIRDLEQVEQIENLQIYYRGVDPTPIANFVMTGFNSITRIGKAVCLPGDVVYGSGTGVTFIPSHLVRTVIERSRKMHVRDIFGFEMLKTRVYTTADIDNAWTIDMYENMERFIQSDPRCEKYRLLDWTGECEEARRRSSH